MSDYGTIADLSSVQFVRAMPGPIERVWTFLTTQKHLSTWLGVGDLGPGKGPFELAIEGPDLPHSTGARVKGEVTLWDPPNALSFTWNHYAPGSATPTIAESLVEMELTAVPAGATLILRHLQIDQAFTARLSTGWHVFLDALKCRLNDKEIHRGGETFPALLSIYQGQVDVLGKPLH